ncbi:MAG: glycosyltransferase family 4 protein [Eubacterium sp.]|nr:glycosyltransferase family 4 protein [Eubacterium sp.]
MKIAFDGQLLLKGDKTGIAWNAHHLIKELLKYPENECVIQCFTCRCTAEQLSRLEEYRRMGCRIESCGWFQNSWYKFVWVLFPIPYRLFFRTKADITQFFNFVVPPGARGKRIAMIHDMAYKSCPGAVRKKTRIWLEFSMKKSCRHADHVVTVSEFSKREIVKYLHVPKEKITVVPNAVDHAIYRPDYTDGQIRSVLDKYKIQKEYFLYLGTIEPRKNLERLLMAYEKLYREEHVPQLVLAGGKGWLCRSIYDRVRSMKLGHQILFTGYVPQEDSPLLMCGALAFVFPSLYEGFGMPPLEAMACGTPVIVSDTSSLPEVVGDAGAMVNAESVEEIYRAMRRLMKDRTYRESLRVRGIERAKKYNWMQSAKILMNVYKKYEKNEKKNERNLYLS